MICFDVDIEPVAQKRHRHASRGKFVQVYDPSKLDKLALLDACMEFAPDEPFDGALSVCLTFTFTRPKSHYGTGKNSDKLKPSAPDCHIKKPDVDNLAKLLLDAFNGVYWRDDSIIDTITIKKRWAKEGSVSVSIYDNI